MIGKILVKNIFSSNFENIVRKLIGLYEDTSLSGLPSLWIGITSAHFHCTGK